MIGCEAGLKNKGSMEGREVYISADRLTRYFDSQCAVDNVSFVIRKGEVVGFLGPNGSGKTTTMRMLVGYLLPSGGRCEVLGVDPVEEPLVARRHIGYLPENNPLYLDMYVEEFLLFMARLYGLRDPVRRVREVIYQVGLSPEAHKPIEALSRGYRQRVGLAHALLHNPEVFILDEPTSGLDPNQVQEIRALIKELGRTHTILLSTHILREVEQICSRVLVISRGKLVADTTTEELMRGLLGRRSFRFKLERLPEGLSLEDVRYKVLEFIRERISMEGELDVSVADDGNVLDVNIVGDDVDLRPYIYQFCVREGLSLLELYEVRSDLEDIFRELTAGISNAE